MAVEAAGLRATLVVVDEHDNTIAALPVLFRQRVAGNDLVRVFGADPSGALRVSASLSYEPASMHLNLRYQGGSPASPRQLLPAFRLLRALRPPARLGMTIEGHSVGVPDGLPHDQEFPNELLEATRSLAFVQAVTGTEFPMPEELDEDDLQELREAESLLMGGTMTGRWSDAKLTVTDPDWLTAVEDADQLKIELVDQKIARIAGHDIQLGEASFVFRTAVVDRASREGVWLLPGTDDRFEVSLLAAPKIGVDLQDVRPPVVASIEAMKAARARQLLPGAFGSAAT